MRKITRIVLHCTATPQTATIESIQNFWKIQLNWRNPGYHYIIEPDGMITQLLPIEEVSNGVRGYNANSIHISYIGGVEGGVAKDNRTCEQIGAQIEILKKLMSRFPTAKIVGHRDLSPDLNNNGIIESWEWTKECPSFDVASWLKYVNLDYAN